MLSRVVGQTSAISALQKAITSGDLPQTYLFTGEPQVGKYTTAVEVAKLLLCNARAGDADSCDRCSSCLSVAAGTNPDVRSVRPSGPSRVLRVAQFWPRDGVKEHPADKALLRDLHFSPVSGKKRIFIVESADSLNEDTGNSLLKVLEEPPSYALFILTATSPEAVLPTIYSRAQVLRFQPVGEPLILQELLHRGLAIKDARLLAAYAQGRPGVALRAASDPTILQSRNEVIKVCASSSMGLPMIAAFKLADDFRKASAKLVIGSGQEEEVGTRPLLSSACELMTHWYRDLLIRRTAGSQSRVLNADNSDEITRYSRRYTRDELEFAVLLIEDVKRYVERNANAQIATEYLMTNLLALGIKQGGSA